MITWDKEAAAAKAARGTFAGKAVRIDVYRNNAEIFHEGGYRTDSGRDVLLPVDDPMLEGTRVYSAPLRVDAVPAVREPLFTDVLNEDALIVAKNLADKGYRPAVLNLADGYTACGFYPRGSRAQEESLCRVSTLSRSLYRLYDEELAREVNVPFVGGGYPMDRRNGGIYSPGVTVFRDAKDSYRLLDEPFKVSVISVAALDFSERQGRDLAFRLPDGGIAPEGLDILREKIRTIHRICLDNGHDSLVAGAFGCGAFRLPAETVASLFRDILDEPEFAGKFRAVVFAILERGTRTSTADRGKFAPFYRLFAR